MAEIESEEKPWKSSLLTILLCVVVMAALILNVLFLFVFIRSKKLRRAPNLFLLNIVVVDLIGAVFWAMPAIVSSAEWKWKFGGGYCKIHGFLGMFCFSMNMYSLAVVAFEKFLKIWFPSRHSDAFHNYTITMVVVLSLWALSIVVSFMPLVGWGVIEFFEYQMQCVTDFVESATHLNFFFINSFCLPVVAIVTLYILTLVRIKVLQKKGTKKNGQVILEEKKDAPEESFAAKMRRQQEKFKYNKQKDTNEPMKNEDDGKIHQSDESEGEAYVSDDNEIFHDYEEYQLKKREREMARRRRKVYAFRQQYLFMAITMLVVSVIYIGLWLPFFIITYTWVYDPDRVKEPTYTTFTLISFFGICYKPLAYVFNKHIRACVKQAFTRQKKKDKKQLVADYMATKYHANDSTDRTAPTSAPSGEDTRPRSRGVESTDLTVDEYGDEIEL